MTTYRLAAYETPLWATQNFSAGRYNHARDGFTQYLSLHPMTPWAELLRNQERRDRDEALMLRAPLWVVRVDLTEAPIELTFENAPDFGLAPGDLVADDHQPCRDFAQGLRDDPTGTRALIAPSAALPGTRNLMLLDPAVAIGYQMEPVAPEDLPLAMAAQDGRCPEGLWTLVHYRGSGIAHPELDAFTAGDEFEFMEPAVTADTLAS